MYRYLLLLLLLPCQMQAQPIFVDRSTQAGINNTGSNRGVAFGDYDGDGLEDIYVSVVNAPNRLYRALGDGKYTEVAQAAGVAFAGSTTTSAWGDIDNDGDLDLYLGNRSHPNKLYRNEGNGTFSNISAEAGVNSGHHTRAVMFADVDQDSYIDLYVANISATNYLYHNNGDGTFTNIVEEANAQDFGIAMGSLFFDYDNDGDPDLYLTHDADQPNILYRNKGDGTFQDVSSFSGANIAANGMGVDFADINGDGHFDLYITNLYSNELLLNQGDGTFSIVTESAGVGDLGMGWGTVFLDCDNDGWEDIYMVNDTYFAPFNNILYRNRGDNTFENISDSTPLESPYGGYGTAAADVNDDGWPDLFVANSGDDGNQLFINFMKDLDNDYVKVKLQGTQSNTAAIGARVTVEAGGRQFMDEVCAGASYASHNSFTLHFGLGQVDLIDRLEVRWPNGLVEVFENISPNTTYCIVEGESMVSSARSAELEPQAMQLFPNPVQERLIVQFHQALAAESELRLYSAADQLQQRERVPAGAQAWEMRLAGQPAGLYVLELRTPAGRTLEKVVKK
jgi:enediyne biosynthesis protein E4